MTRRFCTGMAGHEHWGEIPVGFDEREQKLVCPCGQSLHPTSSDPQLAGYRPSTKVVPLLKPL